ncbi:MAG: high-affinity branched-chain amino acid ABC transporter permease LivM [Desulfobacterales bacterium]|nr:high-affinity branched-chain amino acid ABC transporter permease LivM [Desulfobacterales bacterium]
MINLQEIKKSLLAAAWFMFLTFPIMVIRVNTVQDVIEWRWHNLAIVGFGAFFGSFVWRFFIRRKEMGLQAAVKVVKEGDPLPLVQRLLANPRVFIPGLVAVSALVVVFPFVFSMYQTNIMTNALMFVMLGLGLNIVVGLAGLLDLGYVAFYAVGAYSYALLNVHYGIGFWIALPIGAGLAALFGVLLGFPVLRLRGDYLAIVTLGFGEIIRLVLENWNDFSFGPSGIANIPRPSFFGMEMSLQQNTVYIYFIMVALALFTIFVVRRLENSRLGRAWIALREDEIACQAMGIDKTKTKLTAFALGATWAGMAGVMFAAKTTFINPSSFTIWESVIILCVVVLGGMGSIIGVVCGAMVLILLPEYLRAFSEYRMLIFGAVLVIMMVFRPGGIVINVRRAYQFEGTENNGK